MSASSRRGDGFPKSTAVGGGRCGLRGAGGAAAERAAFDRRGLKAKLRFKDSGAVMCETGRRSTAAAAHSSGERFVEKGKRVSEADGGRGGVTSLGQRRERRKLRCGLRFVGGTADRDGKRRRRRGVVSQVRSRKKRRGAATTTVAAVDDGGSVGGSAQQVAPSEGGEERRVGEGV
ncbi:MAG: hypothetical protein BJ554DRAFT_1784 [Olpidium bornovanus]|uniref:Uncharacterized protein n=1 Tax=Olpidium bornovanus TaxID=278681 RepID=A0A8H7ZRJ0_9FUNG|nr:MAG: hypothetical protein BJ554DRAFT_1784 [Olpidium bornovanus]